MNNDIKIETRGPVTLTVTQVPTTEDATKSYLKKFGFRDDGSNANGNLLKFVAMAKDISQRSGSYSFQDFISLNRIPKYEIPYEELVKYFTSYISEMLRLQKIEEIWGCMEYPVYISIG